MKQVSIKSVLVLMVSLIVVSTPIHANSSQSTQCKGASKKVLKSTLSNYKKQQKLSFHMFYLMNSMGMLQRHIFMMFPIQLVALKKSMQLL